MLTLSTVPYPIADVPKVVQKFAVLLKDSTVDKVTLWFHKSLHTCDCTWENLPLLFRENSRGGMLDSSHLIAWTFLQEERNNSYPGLEWRKMHAFKSSWLFASSIVK